MCPKLGLQVRAAGRLLGVPRVELGLHASAKGLVAGNLRLHGKAVAVVTVVVAVAVVVVVVTWWW